MLIVRRRLIFWLVRAYLKRWGKTILFFFVAGCVLFFFLLNFAPSWVSRVPVFKKETIGIAGVFETQTIPLLVLRDVASGLTQVLQNSQVKPDVAQNWQIQGSGKKYVFSLRPNLSFSDRTKLTSDLISYNFSDATIERPDKNTIVFKLKDVYAPFLTTVARPFYKAGLVGVGAYKVRDISVNGIFVKSITLSSLRSDYAIRMYKFYPSYDDLKLHFVLGDVSKVLGLPDVTFKGASFEKFPNVKVTKKTNYEKLVTLFYNVEDPLISDKKLREALSYAIPEGFSEGEKSYSPYPVESWAHQGAIVTPHQDLAHAQILVNAAKSENKTESISLTIKTFPRYKKTAQEIAVLWQKLGIRTKIEEVSTTAQSFQILLSDFHVSKDPDQYSLWHSKQENNISHYENKRIDKLLEDGRKTIDMEERKKIYADFQKYLSPDPPASFLYFPYQYDVERI